MTPETAGEKFFMSPPERSEGFFEGAREGRLMIQRCESCGRDQFYPRAICIHCGSAQVSWREASGRGTVHTFTVIHQQRMPGWRDEVPYVAAVIDLDEGVRITSTVVDCAPEAVSIGMPVQVTFVDEGPFVLPRFTPVR